MLTLYRMMHISRHNTRQIEFVKLQESQQVQGEDNQPNPNGEITEEETWAKAVGGQGNHSQPSKPVQAEDDEDDDEKFDEDEDEDSDDEEEAPELKLHSLLFKRVSNLQQFAVATLHLGRSSQDPAPTSLIFIADPTQFSKLSEHRHQAPLVDATNVTKLSLSTTSSDQPNVTCWSDQ
ncbi:hypothetical protein CRG98_013754 [Punica granatum]|uniref:Uncharacterized protein n=1 Tax=Punica granatum TaxID=22663 RepID=A0A2I0KCE2_PUNGR|nr:hypothetical protein CRG98_013754 [Punica granatum]